MMNPQPVESLIQELRMHRLALELQCQELQRMQAETEESRDHYRELYESIPIGYTTVDVSGRIYDMNPAGVSLLGIDQAHQSNNFYSFFANDDGDAALLFFRKRLNQQDAGCCDLKMRKRDGGRFLAAVHAVPFKGGTGNGEGLRIAFQDITGRKEIEETLRQHKLELEANRIELQELMAKLFAAQEEERRRIACDLHDDHCQRITALILEASAMERLVKSVMPSLTPRVGSLKSKLGDILDDFRHLTHELHPRHLDTVSLACSMRTYIQEFMEYTRLDVDFKDRDVAPHLPMPITICLYRLLQESLGNIRTHANAKHVSVELSCSHQEVELRVLDDGSGFTFEDSKKGLGLTSMQERVRPLRGHVVIDSTPGQGTVVTVKIPVLFEE